MADFNALEALINAHIKKNGVQAITGNILNGILRGMVSALGKGYTIAGSASPATDPGTMTGPLAYIAYTAGTYTHFGGLEVEQGEVAMLIYNEAEWHKEVLFSLSATATIDGNVGTPEVGVSFVDGLLTFDFRNMKGNPGNDGDAAGFGTISATVDGNIGTPGVSVQTSGPDTAKNIAFQFTNLKGETGVTSVVATVDNTVGTPTCTVSLVGQQLTLAFSGLKGAQGDTGSSVDYPFTIVNNLTTNDATQALSAAMGVELAGQVSQLEHKVDDLSTGKYYGYFATSADLPDDATVDGFAYVGTASPYTIYNLRGGVWTSSGITVNQSPIGNDEDIDQNEDGKLQFANRVYNVLQPNGMGYKILRKDATFASQVTDTNTIYEIRYNFNNSGSTVTLPNNCVLHFVGGKISGGTINFGDAYIDADNDVVFDGVTIENCTSKQRINAKWFGMLSTNADNSPILQSLVNNFLSVFIPNGEYTCSSTIVVSSSSALRFLSSNKAMMGYYQTKLYFPSSDGFRIERRIEITGIYFGGNRGTFNANTGVYEGGFIGIDCRSSCRLIDIDINEFMIGIDTQNGLLVNACFEGVVVEKCGNIGINWIGYSADNHNNIACLVTRCYIVNTGKDGLVEGTDSTGLACGHGMVIKGGSGNSFISNVFEYNSGCGVYVMQSEVGYGLRGFNFTGNNFEYNKKANLFIDMDSSNSALYENVFVKGNFYSDANKTIPADSFQNRKCSVRDKFAWMFRKYFFFDGVDRTLYEKYGKPGVILDSDMLDIYNTDISQYDATSKYLKFIYGKNTEYFYFVRCFLPIGVYAIVVNCKNAGSNNRVMALRWVLNGTSTNHTQSIFTSWNTFRDVRIGANFFVNNDGSEFRIDTISINSMAEGDEIDVQSVAVLKVDSLTTTEIDSILTSPPKGFTIFDSTRGKMIVWNGAAWVNMDGTALS